MDDVDQGVKCFGMRQEEGVVRQSTEDKTKLGQLLLVAVVIAGESYHVSSEFSEGDEASFLVTNHLRDGSSFRH